jgi:hypothetical protein
MTLPPLPTLGNDILEWAQGVQAYLKALTPLRSGTVWPSMGPGGTSFRALGRPTPATELLHREFDIRPAGPGKVVVYNGTIFGEMPDGFSVNDDPIFEIPDLAHGDEIYAAYEWNRKVPADGAVSYAFSNRTIEKASITPDNDPLAGLFYVRLATIAMSSAEAVPQVAQGVWGPIDVLPGTASNNYIMPYPGTDTSAYEDYWDLLYSSKGQKTDEEDIAPDHDSVQTIKTGLCRVVKYGAKLKIFIRILTINSIGQITHIGPETLEFDETVINA